MIKLKKHFAKILCGALFISSVGFYNVGVKAQELVDSEEVAVEDYTSDNGEIEDTALEEAAFEENAEDDLEAESIDDDNITVEGAVEGCTVDDFLADDSEDKLYSASDCATITLTTDVTVTPKEQILKRINDIRWEAYAKYKLIPSYTPIKWSSDLEEIAFQRAAESTVFWGHTRPDGTSCFTCKAASGGESWGEIIASPSGALYAIELWYDERDLYRENKDNPAAGHYAALIKSNYIGIASCGVTVGECSSYQQGTEEQKCTSGTKTVQIKVDKGYRDAFIFDFDGIDNSGALTVGIGGTKKISIRVYPQNGWLRVNSEVSALGTFKSSNTSVVTVDNYGNVKGVSKGKATITYSNGYETASFDVSVKDYVEMYRLYNPNSGEHFYTANEGGKNHLVSVGWNYEGIGWKAPVSSNTPVYRLYNPNAGDHHYTMNTGERDHLVSVGWNYEGIGWYSDDAQAVPLYRQYNPNAETGSHNYTTNKAENDWLVSIGWNAEGIGWYGVK